MDQKQLVKKMIEFNQSTFNNSFQALALLQDQFERIANTAIDQASWMPAEGRKAIENWVEAYKTGRDNFKSHVDDSYKHVERFFAD
ncbi:MAG: hypothetical protein PVH87_24400 [Desulfobacteraceae bacterium]|jgi:hypothetical protein